VLNNVSINTRFSHNSITLYHISLLTIKILPFTTLFSFYYLVLVRLTKPNGVQKRARLQLLWKSDHYIFLIWCHKLVSTSELCVIYHETPISIIPCDGAKGTLGADCEHNMTIRSARVRNNSQLHCYHIIN